MKYLLVALVVILSVMCGFLYSQNKVLVAAVNADTEYTAVSAGKAISASFKNAR